MFITGTAKFLLYVGLAVHVALRYLCRPRLFGWRPWRYVVFLKRALRLLVTFRHGKAVRVPRGIKIHLYLPAWPTPAFFHAIEHKLLQQPPGPITVVYSMTRACRYKCPHCYQRHDHGDDLADHMLYDVARQLNAAGVAMFDIEGGEPFRRYQRLLGLVRAIGPKAELWANTSGDGVDGDRLAELRVAGLHGLMVSVHSPEAGAHDAFTGVPGSFEVACEALRLCGEYGLIAAVNSVLDEDELRAGKLDELMALATELRCHFVQLIHPKPSGAWLGKEDGLQQDSDLLASIRARHREYNSGRHPQAPALAAQVFEEQPHVFGCTAGAVDRFYVNANGEVQPCEFLNISFGNLQEDSWQTILARLRAAFPTPGTDWLCCTQAQAIRELIDAVEPRRTPLLWSRTKELVATWDRGPQTPLYQRLGIYR